jgi:hypothetical protein
VAGFVAGLLTGTLLTLRLCRQPTDVGPACSDVREYVPRWLVLSAGFGAAGAATGALVGAGVPMWRVRSADGPFHERGGHDLIGGLTVAVGVATALGEPQSTSGAFAVSFVSRFGRHLGAGPELGYFHLGRTQLISASGSGPWVTREARHLGGAVQVRAPAGSVEGRATLGLSWLSRRWDGLGHTNHLAGSLGVGGSWWLSQALALAGDVRLWTVLDKHRRSAAGLSVATLTAGPSARW